MSEEFNLRSTIKMIKITALAGTNPVRARRIIIIIIIIILVNRRIFNYLN
jgi:hypothetical protein